MIREIERCAYFDWGECGKVGEIQVLFWLDVTNSKNSRYANPRMV